jgi:hypothetical protein
MIVIYLMALSTPLMAASNFPFVYEDTGYDDSGYGDEEFINTVYETEANRQLLTEQYDEQMINRNNAYEAIEKLQTMEKPSGWDTSEWSSYLETKVSDLKAYASDRDSFLSRSQEKIKGYVGELNEFRSTIKTSSNPKVQEMGGWVAVAGSTAAVPVYSPFRPTAAGMAGDLGQVARYAGQGTINARIGQPGSTGLYQNAAAKTTTWAANANTASQAAASTTVKYTPQIVGQGAAARVQLVPEVSGSYYGNNPPKAIKTSIPGKIQTADGTWVDNKSGLSYAKDLGSLQQSKTAIELSIAKHKSALVSTTNNKVAGEINKKITALEAKRAKLDGTINEYNSNNMGLKQKAIGLAKSAGKWAAFSVGAAYVGNVYGQLADNGWKISDVNWGMGEGGAGAMLKEGWFWGGTAGSFVGSMAGTAIASAIPGGAFIKTLFAIGGAAIGWQAGSGNLKNTDWVKLGATTVGSTIGAIAGGVLLSFLGPFGAMIGGMVGHVVAGWLVDKVRGWLAADNMTYSRPEEKSDYTPSSDNSYVGSAYGDQTDYSNNNQSSGSGEASVLAAERNSIMTEIRAAMEVMPPDMSAVAQLQQRLQQLDSSLNAQRASQYGTHFSNGSY